MRDGFCLYKVGIVSEYKQGYARVFFEKEGILSDWLPVNYGFTKGNKQLFPLVIETQVHCLMDEHCEEGVIIGGTYNDVDTPPSNDDRYTMEFDGGITVSIGDKYKLMKGSDTLKQILTLIVEAVQATVVLQGNNPDAAKLSQALGKINAIME
jgi:phage baseplate assembly protein gpV